MNLLSNSSRIAGTENGNLVVVQLFSARARIEKEERRGRKSPSR